MLEKLPSIVGHALQGLRPGMEKILYNDPALQAVPESLTLESAAFDAPTLPQRFTEDGEGLSPPFAWKGVPAGAASLLLVIEDADSPTPTPLVHAIVYDLPPRDDILKEGAIATLDDEEHPHTGLNSFFNTGYLPPDPPPGHGPHRYVAQIYALDAPSGFKGLPRRPQVRDLLHKHAIARGMICATYVRH
ncbi:MAG TPA: YbhB/YbcL family Raf kinase inhibitor-like protein [Caulobacter sp.]|nr:YbhB/YbcL family Raf kinase inhibitor-like protein [Caulobacter sp.]